LNQGRILARYDFEPEEERRFSISISSEERRLKQFIKSKRGILLQNTDYF
jgi:hypothetical protein